jgi:hypothetical protein
MTTRKAGTARYQINMNFASRLKKRVISGIAGWRQAGLPDATESDRDRLAVHAARSVTA